MEFKKKEAVFIGLILLLLVIFLSFFIVRYIGYTIQTTPSKVSIDEGILVIYNEFKDSSQTTDFLRKDDLELETLVNMTLENSHGKIIFSEEVNLTQDVVNNVIDLDRSIDILYNLIEIDTTALTSLEKPATLYLYGLTVNNPRILKNGEICPSSICQEINYSGRTLIFTTTQFSNYSVEETPEELETPGTGSSLTKIRDFILDKDLIKVSLKQGEHKREIIEIKNTGDTDLDITLNTKNIEKFLVISETSFLLEKGKTKKINIDFFAKENEIPDAYLGNIEIKSGNLKKTINVILEIIAKNPLFDIKVELDKKEIIPGEQIEAKVNITNVGDKMPIDVLLYYAIEDFDGNILLLEKESLAIEKNLLVIRKLNTPEDIKKGNYVFYSQVLYENISAATATSLKIVEKTPFSKSLILPIIILLLLIVIIFIICFKKREKRKKKPRKKRI